MTVPAWVTIGIEMAKRAPSLATLLVLGGIVLWLAWGYHYGYAKADELSAVKADVAQLKADVKTIKDDGKKSRREQLEGQMFQARVDQCKSESPELKRMYANRLADLELKYVEAGGANYRLPTCGDLE